MPYGSILRHVVGGIGVVAVVFLLTNEHIVIFDVSIYRYLPGLLVELAICCATYLGITYVIDKRQGGCLGWCYLRLAHTAGINLKHLVDGQGLTYLS